MFKSLEELVNLSQLTIDLSNNSIDNIDSFKSLEKLVYLNQLTINLKNNKINNIAVFKFFK